MRFRKSFLSLKSTTLQRTLPTTDTHGQTREHWARDTSCQLGETGNSGRIVEA